MPTRLSPPSRPSRPSSRFRPVRPRHLRPALTALGVAAVLAVTGGCAQMSERERGTAQGAGAVAPGPTSVLNLPLAAAFAFLGGLILNLMPCVFPILSMKAATLAGHGGDAKGARIQGLAFFAGVLATFLGLAGLLIAAKAGGAAVGWGFQLQSPAVVACLALIMLAVALNLSGVFEIGASAQGIGSGLAGQRGLAGSFFTGVLAVVVAAPCTAPFMATALGYAMTQPPAVALAVFAALAAGFAAPFTGLAFAPALISRLPRPGAWMEGLRRVLAFPMYAAAAWLVWVLAQQGGSAGLARLMAAAVGLAFAAWLFGRAQPQLAEGRRPLVSLGLAALFALAAFAGVIWPAYAAPPAAASSAAVAAPTGGAANLQSVPFSPEKLAALRAELTTPVPEWHGGTDPDSVTERRREALRGRPTDGGLMREPTRGDGTMGAQQKTAPAVTGASPPRL